MRTGRFARISGLAVIAALLCIIVTVTTAYADAYDTSALGTSPQVYLAMSQTATSFTDTASGDACVWHSALASHSSGPGSATHSGNFTNYSYCELGASYAMGSAGSLSFWYESNSGGSIVDNMPVIDFCVTSSNCSSEVRAYVDVANKLCLQLNGSGVCGSVFGGSTGFSDASAWHFHAVTWSGTTVKFYYDGTITDTVTIGGAGTSFSSSNGLVGARWANGDYLTGYVARWLLNATALTSGQISTLYASTTAGAPAHMTITPGFLTEPVGATWTWTLLSTDATGTDVTGSSVYSIVDATGLTCDGVSVWPHTLPSSTAVCTYTGTAGGDFVVHFADTAHSLNAYALVTIVGSVNRFTLGYALPVPFVFGQQGTFYGSAYDAAGKDVSATDPFTVDAAAHQTCGTVTQHFASGVAEYYQVTCSWDASGDYILSAKDAQGFPTSVSVHVDAASTATTCGSTDLGCWLNQLWDAISSLAQIPFQMVSGIITFLTVSQSGKSYIDTSVVTSGAFLPSVDCRSGQAPTAPDGVHCFPFPISLPFDVQTVFNLINVSPTAPSFSLSWTFTFMGTAIPVTHAFDVSAILNDSFMTYVRGAELVVFIIGTAFGTWRFVNLVGAI